jgi:transposase InsO family protein
MTYHRNAKLTLRQRHELVLEVESGSTLRAAAAARNVAVASAHRWWRRWREAGPEERASLACLHDRSSRPRRSPRMLSAVEQDRICAVRERTGWGPRLIASEVRRPHSTVHRTLQRRGCSRRPRAPREAVVRYEWPCPGQLLHMDTKRLQRFTRPGHAVTGDRTAQSRGAGHEYAHSLLDDCSRLAYTEVLDDEKAATATAFTARALDWFLDHGIVAERLLTDNAWCYTKNRGLHGLLAARAIDHKRTRAYSPKTNGKVERYQQTLEREWEKGLTYASSADRRDALPHWLEHYNTRRRHSGIGNVPPLTRVHNLLGQDN